MPSASLQRGSFCGSIHGFAQEAAIGGITDQGLVALLQLDIEGGDDGLTVAAILLGLGLIATDDGDYPEFCVWAA